MSSYASSSVEYEQLMQAGSSSADDDDVIYTRQHPTHAPTRNGCKNSKKKRRRPLLFKRRRSPSPGGVQLSRDGLNTSSVCSHCTSSCTPCTVCVGPSDPCGWARCVPTTSGVIFFLLLVAFPVHFVDLVITGVSSNSSSSVDQYFLVFVCFYSTAILSATLSPISVCILGFKWTVVCACAGVTFFTLAKCLSVYSYVLTPLASAINGLTFGSALAAFRSRSTVVTDTSSKATVSADTTAVSQATVTVETASELASRCGRILWSCASAYVCLNGASSAVSAVFWLALFVPRVNRQQMTSSTASQDISVSSDNVTSPMLRWTEETGATCGRGFRPSLGSELRQEAGGYHNDAEALVYRRQALIGCFLMCSLGALLLSLAVLGGRRTRPLEAEERSTTFFSRLCRRKVGRLSELLGQMVGRNCCLVLLESVFLGSQQLFMYFLYLQVGAFK